MIESHHKSLKHTQTTFFKQKLVVLCILKLVEVWL